MTTAISGRPARSIDNAFCETGRRNPGLCPGLPSLRRGKALAAVAKAQGEWGLAHIGRDRGRDDPGVAGSGPDASADPRRRIFPSAVAVVMATCRYG